MKNQFVELSNSMLESVDGGVNWGKTYIRGF